MPSIIRPFRRKQPADEHNPTHKNRPLTETYRQSGRYPDPPKFVGLRGIVMPKRRKPPKPGSSTIHSTVVPHDILQSFGDTFGPFELSKDAMLTYSIIGGVFGDYGNPATLRGYPASVNKYGGLSVNERGASRVDTYENSVVSGTPVTADFNPAPTIAVLISNQGTASITVELAGHYLTDGKTPDFTQGSAMTFPAGFTATIQGQFVGAYVATASGSAQSYLLWAFS